MRFRAGLAVLIALLLAPSLALAQGSASRSFQFYYSGTGAITAPPSWLPVSPTNALPVNCITGCTGGGGAVTQGPTGTNAAAWWVQIGDTVNGPAAVKAASTAPATTDPAVVVAVSPNVTPITPVIAGSGVSSSVLKASAGNLYRAYAACTSACWLMVFNAVSTPSNGATTAGISSGNLQECVPINAGGFGSIDYGAALPEAFSVGITAAISSTACGTLTLASTGFINGQAK